MSGVSVVSVSAGAAHSMFLSDTGLLFGCGLNSRGQVGPLALTPAAGDVQGAEESVDKSSKCVINCCDFDDSCLSLIPFYQQPQRWL